MTDWSALSARTSMASHRLVGWIYWDPPAIAAYEALGIPNGFGYYTASRAAPLAAAGADVVAAAFGSIHPGFIAAALEMCEAHTTWEAVAHARNDAVAAGLRTHAPEVCEPLGAMAEPLWRAADQLPVSARPLYAAHRGAERPADQLVSAWLAVNCIREWRGDTHWAILAAEDVSGTQAGILHNAHLNYPPDWIPRSRGADDAALDAAWTDLAARGLATSDRPGERAINAAGLRFRQDIEDRTDRLSEHAWRTLGAEDAEAFVDLVAPVGERLLARIDETAGPDWMPAARTRRTT